MNKKLEELYRKLNEARTTEQRESIQQQIDEWNDANYGRIQSEKDNKHQPRLYFGVGKKGVVRIDK